MVFPLVSPDTSCFSNLPMLPLPAALIEWRVLRNSEGGEQLRTTNFWVLVAAGVPIACPAGPVSWCDDPQPANAAEAPIAWDGEQQPPAGQQSPRSITAVEPALADPDWNGRERPGFDRIGREMDILWDRVAAWSEKGPNPGKPVRGDQPGAGSG